VIERIVPLGLTPNEAKGWYLRAVLMPWLLRGVFAIGTASVIILSMITPLGAYLESTLTLNMAHGFLYIAAGFLISYGVDSLIFAASAFHRKVAEIYGHLLTANSVFNKWGIAAFVTASLLTAYWYLPANFDAAVLSVMVHFEMHVTLFVVGVLVFGGSRGLTKRARQLAPIVLGKAMGLYGAILLLTPTRIYSVYPAPQQAEAGVVMEVLMLVLDLTVLPIWLFNYFGRGPVSLERQS
jgi:cytochrome c oxidase assembly factor CtaG